MRNREMEAHIERIVNQEVLMCQTSLVEKLLSEGIVNYEDITNIYPDNSEAITENEEKIEELKENERYSYLEDNYMKIDEKEEKELDVLNEAIEAIEDNNTDLENEQEEPAEIYEWWVITDWLAEKLEKAGKPILTTDYGTWWGRTCSGQSISMDGVMKDIAQSIYPEVESDLSLTL